MDSNNCNCSKSFATEYPCMMKGCVRKVRPDCKVAAVIPSVTVDTAEGIESLSDCYVHVTSNNTTYYIDDKHQIMTIWAGPVEVPDYDLSTNPLRLRSQFCLVHNNESDTMAYFDKQGLAHILETAGGE